MKKDLIFAPLMLIVGIALFLLKSTGVTAHIAISVVGVALLIVYSVLTKKNWKTPALEVIMRVCYGIALITGILLMKISGVAVIAVLHKIGAALFVVLLIGLTVHKSIASKKA